MIVSESTVVIESEYTVFSIGGGIDERLGGPSVPANTLVQFPGGGEQWDSIWVLAGTQFGPYSVTARELAADPGTPGEEWEDVVELSVKSPAPLLVIEDFADPRARLSSAGGAFRVRVSARGRTESASRAVREPYEDENPDEPLEHYLLELWPAPLDEPVVVRQDSGFARNDIEPPKNVAEASEIAAFEAGQRVLWSATGAAPPTDARGEVRVAAELTGTLARVRSATMTKVGWPFCNGANGVFDAVPGNRTGWSLTPPRIGAATGYVSDAGEIETTVLEVEGRHRLVRSWNMRLRGPTGFVRPDSPKLLPVDAVLETTWSGKRGEPVVVEILLQGVPQAWQGDLAVLWRWDLEQTQSYL